MRMQDKIMAAIKSAIESKGYEFVQKANFTNCGSVFIQKTDGFTSFLEFFYDFQDRYVSFEFTRTTPKKSFHMFYSEGDKIESFIATVCSQLPIIKTPKKKTVPIKDDLATPLRKLLADYAESAGTNTRGAIRDCMTDLILQCEKENLNSDEIFQAANEVAAEKTAIS